MKNLLYAAVHTTEYGTEATLFHWPSSGDKPLPPSDPIKLAEFLGIKNFDPEIENLTAALVKNPNFQP